MIGHTVTTRELRDWGFWDLEDRLDRLSDHLGHYPDEDEEIDLSEWMALECMDIDDIFWICAVVLAEHETVIEVGRLAVVRVDADDADERTRAFVVNAYRAIHDAGRPLRPGWKREKYLPFMGRSVARNIMLATARAVLAAPCAAAEVDQQWEDLIRLLRARGEE